MRADEFEKVLGIDFYAGVPDSLLKPFINYLMGRYGVNNFRHVIGANEGNCAALAAGYHLATGKIPAVYLQNSGEGNVVNPVLSLLSKQVYGIPVLFIIGWRGEPDVHDEPQHIHQGGVTLKLLEDIGVEYFIFGRDTTTSKLQAVMDGFRKQFAMGHQAALVICKGALVYDDSIVYHNSFSICREEAIRQIVEVAKNDIVIVTTGKAGRELYEIREERGEGHEHDFLMIGSMGHASSFALGIAMHKPEKRIWCLDGDGAMLMHLGAMATIGRMKPSNLVHVLLNNAAHESVGGMPTAQPDFCKVAEACGYEKYYTVDDDTRLQGLLKEICQEKGLRFLQINCKLGSRSDLGRPQVMRNVFY